MLFSAMSVGNTTSVIDERVWSKGSNDLQRWENVECFLVQFDIVMVLLALKQVSKFIHLGSIITDDGKNKEDLINELKESD